MIALPDIRQRTTFDCGTACFVLVCRTLGVRIAYDDALTLLHTNEIDGTDYRTLEASFRSQGLRVLSGEMDADDLRSLTGRGRPVVAALSNHWVVVAGVSRGRVAYHDPETGPVRLGVGEFTARWRELDRTGSALEGFGLAVWR